jgi:hypothetical protein
MWKNLKEQYNESRQQYGPRARIPGQELRFLPERLRDPCEARHGHENATTMMLKSLSGIIADTSVPGLRSQGRVLLTVCLILLTRCFE